MRRALVEAFHAYIGDETACISSSREAGSLVGRSVGRTAADEQPTDSAGLCPSSALTAAANMSVDTDRPGCSCWRPRRLLQRCLRFQFRPPGLAA